MTLKHSPLTLLIVSIIFGNCTTHVPIVAFAQTATGLHATVIAQPSLRVDCSPPGVCGTPSSAPGVTPLVSSSGSYAYAPADIDYQNVAHLFFCSGGTGEGSIDNIRYINNQDAILKNILNPLGNVGNKSDLAACDPEVVLFKGYFYLFYGSTRAVDAAQVKGTTGLINVIHLARSAEIGGPYQILDQHGAWKTTTDTPKHIIPPHVLSIDRTQGQGYIGASWPSVVVRNETLFLWYEDDTADPVPGYDSHRYYFLQSSDASQWDTATEQQTDIKEFVHSGEVKYDPGSNQFVMFSVFGANAKPSSLGLLYSSDGIHWSHSQKITDLPGYSHNVGVESDERGILPSEAHPVVPG